MMRLTRTGSVLTLVPVLVSSRRRKPMQSDGAARPMGRPRDARADRAILEATLELIAERGIHEFRTEDVAARAGVGKGAIYRRFRSKDDLVTAAIAAVVSEEITVPDTGSTRADL